VRKGKGEGTPCERGRVGAVTTILGSIGGFSIDGKRSDCIEGDQEALGEEFVFSMLKMKDGPGPLGSH